MHLYVYLVSVFVCLESYFTVLMHLYTVCPRGNMDPSYNLYLCSGVCVNANVCVCLYVCAPLSLCLCVCVCVFFHCALQAAKNVCVEERVDEAEER